MFLGQKSLAKKSFVFFLAFVLFISACPALALPTSIGQKQTEADKVSSQIDTIDKNLEEVTEEYNLANMRLEETERAIAENQARLDKTISELKHHQKVLNKRLIKIYKQDRISLLSLLVSADSFESFLSKIDFLVMISSQDATLVKKVRKLKEEIEATREKLENEKRERLVLKEEAKRKRSQIEAQISERKAFLASIEADIKEMIEEEARREARLQAERAGQAVPSPGRSKNPGGSPSSGGGAGNKNVVSIALSYLGVSYVYGGTSPETGFDCSGFTMYVYAQVGVSLPHYSAWQYRCGTSVAYENLQPGDLVFFGKGGISHVGIYIGNGNYVHAPHTGDVVKISRLAARSDYVGACHL